MKKKRSFGTKKTSRTVLIADVIADYTIRIGGLTVIGAVFLMMLFLFSQVVPLFRSGDVLSHDMADIPAAKAGVTALTTDEFKTIAVRVADDGSVLAWHLPTKTPVKAPAFDFGGKEVSTSVVTLDGMHLAVGFTDGTVRFGSIKFNTEIYPEEQLPEGLKKLDERDRMTETEVYSFIPGSQVRRTWVETTLEEEIQVSDAGAPIEAMDYRYASFGERPTKILATIDSTGVGRLLKVESNLNLFTRELTTEVTKCELPPLPATLDIKFALVTELADSVYFAEESGKIHRFNTRDFENPFLAESNRVTDQGVNLNALRFLLGEGSMMAGGSDGSVNAYYLLRRKDPNSVDGFGLIRTKTFEPQPAPIVALAPSQRGRTFASADKNGGVWLRQGTSQNTLLKLEDADRDVCADGGKLILTARQDGLLAVTGGGTVRTWHVDLPHPETSLKTLFGKVWYEGYPEPTYTWQSTGATDAFEPKMSLVPLIFGTLKATFYALLFAVPIALLAAVYTSEFLHPSVRGKIKPSIEVMASIPSVVLGFIAALVLAPVVEMWIAAVILAFVVIPTSLILGAYLWQLLPPTLAVRLQGSPKFAMIFVFVLSAVYFSYLLGPVFEDVFFSGDFKAWVNGDRGSAAPFWFLLLLPLSAICVAGLSSHLFGEKVNEYMRTWQPVQAAGLDLGRWLGIALGTVCVSWICAVLLETAGIDARGGVVDTYVQRNTLIVGFAMGFAVIPLIYTLSEDALNAVPEHLRAASLGCGATPWQTAIWVILPTAVSGVFSAAMIGMGRAVGETMIVVMSAGNTPLIDMNIFNGLRALSANIAVELPEAPKDGTLYRVLFLTGLVLFAMTFVINTMAEMVRLRFRKKSLQL